METYAITQERRRQQELAARANTAADVLYAQDEAARNFQLALLEGDAEADFAPPIKEYRATGYQPWRHQTMEEVVTDAADIPSGVTSLDMARLLAQFANGTGTPEQAQALLVKMARTWAALYIDAETM